MQALIQNKEFNLDQKDGQIAVNGQSKCVDFCKLNDGTFSIIIDNHQYKGELIHIDKEQKEITFNINQNTIVVKVKTKIDLLLEQMGLNVSTTKKMGDLKAPMPGLVLSIKVVPGDEVKKGDILLVLEAMKMENILKASADGKIAAIKVDERQAVEKGETLIAFE